MIAENPSPDNDTMETLIETNEQLSKALNQHQRGILSARKVMGLGNGESGVTPPSATATPAGRTESGFAAPPGPPPNHSKPSRKAVPKAPQIPPPGDYAPTDVDDDNENPFSDPLETSTRNEQKPPFPKDKPPTTAGLFNDRLGIEPYHPGFQETQSYTDRQDDAGETSGNDNVRNQGHRTQASGKAPVYRY